MSVRLSQPIKAVASILVTLAGMLTLFSDVHSMNMDAPMYVTPSGMVMFFREVQLSKAP